MNNAKFHHSLFQPTQLGPQFAKSNKENVEDVSEEFFMINQHQNDGGMSGTDVTEHIRKKKKLKS